MKMSVFKQLFHPQNLEGSCNERHSFRAGVRQSWKSWMCARDCTQPVFAGWVRWGHFNEIGWIPSLSFKSVRGTFIFQYSANTPCSTHAEPSHDDYLNPTFSDGQALTQTWALRSSSWTIPLIYHSMNSRNSLRQTGHLVLSVNKDKRWLDQRHVWLGRLHIITWIN